jgi:magnesium transporter
LEVNAKRFSDTAPAAERVGNFMNTEVVSVHVNTDQEECAKLLDRYDQITLPVVDDNARVLGVITVDDLIDVLQEEADDDIAHLGASEPLEGNYLKAKITTMVRMRATWLVLVFVAASLTTSIIAAFEQQLEAVALLAVFIPLLIGTGVTLAPKQPRPSSARWRSATLPPGTRFRYG